MAQITLALVDDHELVREGLAAWLAAHADVVEVLISASGLEELHAGPGWGADVVLLDLNLGDGSAVTDNIAAVIAACSRVVVVSENEQPAMAEPTLRAGALGYVPSRRVPMRWSRRYSRPMWAGRHGRTGLRIWMNSRHGDSERSDERETGE